jgi:serine/threonine-protein phosphatase 6 regulatory subunit 3
MSSPSPGSFPGSPSDGQNGPSTNRFSRELVSGKTMHTFVQFMLDDVPFGEEPMSEIRIDDPQPLTVPLPEDRPDSRNSSSSSSSSDHVTSSQATSEPEPYTSAPSLPNAESATSSVVNIISVIIELIRKNNTDYSEPYLFHTLRNRLIQIQQHLPQLLHIPEHIDQAKRIEMERQALEDAMSELVDQMGIVHLGPMLTILTARLHDFQELLRRPRSLVRVSILNPLRHLSNLFLRILRKVLLQTPLGQ